MIDESRSGARIEHSWDDNAAAWTATVREGRIESRRLVTDAAVLREIEGCAPRRVLDIGCGEGWLCRELLRRGIQASGVDAARALVDAARQAGAGDYLCCSYAGLAAQAERLGRFDLLVCNFALFEERLAPFLCQLHLLLADRGSLLIQTLHPWTGLADGPYRDAWRVEDFAGFDAAFSAPMPWFYRRLESWISELTSAGWRIDAIREPLHPLRQQPASLLLIASSES